MAGPLDGHIHRSLEGKTVESAMKNGERLILRMTNGQEYVIGWVNPYTGEPAPGEPCLERIDVRITIPGVLTRSLAGEM